MKNIERKTDRVLDWIEKRKHSALIMGAIAGVIFSAGWIGCYYFYEPVIHCMGKIEIVESAD